jgi:hypothetical protein
VSKGIRPVAHEDAYALDVEEGQRRSFLNDYRSTKVLLLISTCTFG